MRKFMIVAATAALAACGQPTGEASKAQTDAQQSAPAVAPVVVMDPWAAVTPDGASVAAGYAMLDNSTGAADRLLSASSPRAKAVEIHEMVQDGAMMQMRPIAGGLEVGAENAVMLEPGGKHLMFIGIDAPFKQGETVPVTLVFEKGGAMDVAFEVRPRDAAGAHGSQDVHTHADGVTHSHGDDEPGHKH